MKWREILEKVERGELSAEEGAAMMGEKGTSSPGAASSQVSTPPLTPAAASSQVSAPPAPPAAATNATGAESAGRAQVPTGEEAGPEPDSDLDERLEYWKRWWLIPLWVGMGIFLVGATLIAWGYTSQRTFWFACGFFPLLLGLLGMFLSWWSQTARWLHVRVRDTKGGKINRVMISLPVPIRLGGWFLRVFGDMIPGLREQANVREMLPSLLTALENDREPMSVEVNDKDGSEVKVYFT